MKLFPYDEVLDEPKLLNEKISDLKSLGFLIINFSFSASSKNNIFEFVNKEFPLDPLLEPGFSWDALSDSIGGGLEKFRHPGILVIVKNSLSKSEKPSPSEIEFIDILFHLKKNQLFESMKIFLLS